MNHKLTSYQNYTPSQQFLSKPVISIQDGLRIGSAVDILVNPTDISIAALVLERDRLLSPGLKAAPASEVRVWGKDALLAEQTDIVMDQDAYPEIDNWMSIGEDILGRDAVNLSGEKIGVIQDLLIDVQGQVVGYELNPSDIGFFQRISDEDDGVQYLAVSSIRSLGKDVILMDIEQETALEAETEADTS